MIFRLIFLILLLSGWGLAAAALHVIRTPTTITVVPKDRLGFTDTYVDTRAWTIADVARHPGLTRRLLSLDKQDLLRNVADPNDPQPLEVQLLNALRSHGDTDADGLSLGRVVSLLDIPWQDR